MLKYFSNYSKVKQLFRRLLAVVPSSVRLGRGFWEWYAFFEASEIWNKEHLYEFQLNRIHDLLSELSRTSSFYRQRIGTLNAGKITSLDEFRALIPTLSRLEYYNHYSEILSSTWQAQKLVKSQTSGTTGLALQFYHTIKDQSREWAAICHQWKRVGFSPDRSRRAEFRGLPVHGQLVERFPHQNMVRCSILNLKKEHVLYYAQEIRKNKIDFYHGYPSALYLLSLEILNNGIAFPQPKAVLLASEVVYDWQLEKIQEAFPDSKLYAHYGCAERTVLAGWCEYRREYHILPQYALVEVDDKTSEIIGTNLYNSVNGFIRYRMTDTVLKTETAPCPECRRPYIPRLVELGGRTEDFLFSPENGWIPPAIVTYPLKSLKAVREIQFFQKEKSELCIRYTTPAQDSELLRQDLDGIRSGLHDLFGAGMNFKFEQVANFERGPTGKFKWIICKLEESPSGKRG